MLATYASIVGAELPVDAGPDSFDFSPVLLGQQPTGKPIRESLVIRSGGGAMTIRSREWKLITALGSGGFSKPRRLKPEPGGSKGQLYNLADDLGETNNLYQKCPDIVQRLTAELSRIHHAEWSRN